MVVAFSALFVAFFGAPVLRHAGLSVLATDVIQLASGVVSAAIVVQEFRVQLARERAAGVAESRTMKALVFFGAAATLAVWLVLIIGRNR